MNYNGFRKQESEAMNTPNWQKNSGKVKKGRGIAKGRLRARKQTLQALKAKLLNNET